MPTTVTITIDGSTPPLKNSKRLVWVKGRPRVIPSKRYKVWETAALAILKTSDLVDHKWQYPVTIDFHFYRPSKRRFDYINLAQGPLDVLVAVGILADDDMKHVVPGEWGWSVDKDNPRVELVIRD
jgi:Holliday junction resolvase RusA-like endonuclease